MKIVLPTDTTHEIKLTPRYYPSNLVAIYIYTNATQAETRPGNTYRIEQEKMIITFDFDFTKDEGYKFRIVDGDEIVFRGNIFCTDQVPQDYKIDKEVYIYE